MTIQKLPRFFLSLTLTPALVLALALALALAFFLPRAHGGQLELTTPSIPRLTPAPHHQKLDQTITNLLSYYHYRQGEVDNPQSSAIFDAYIDSLDFNRLYLLEQDIKRFEKYRYLFDDYLNSGNLEPAYEIFNTYMERLAARTARLKVQLERSISFNVDETLELDREDASWAKNKVELDEVWRKRIKNELLLLVLAGQDMEAAKQTLAQRYEGRLRRTTQYKSEDVFYLYMNAVAASYDPHTTYFSPRHTENFNIQMRLSLEGIGTVLRMEEEQITVVELIAGGPASLSQQLHPNDKIVGVGQGNNGDIVDVVGWRLDDVVDLIRGPRGSVVRLEILPFAAGANAVRKEIRLVRDTIKLEKQAAKSSVKSVPTASGKLNIGIINIPTFYSDFAAAQRGERDYRSTTRDVRRLLRDLKQQNVDGVLIDLRQNGGGSLQEAIALTGLFINEGPVVQVRNARGNIEIERDPDPKQVYDGPLAVLVDRFSASASEIFAGAIQDYGRGIVLGEPTFGKGTVQTLIDLNRFVTGNDSRLGQLKLTIAKFYRVNGSSTQHRGVTPDIIFPSPYDSGDVGESAQDFALPWDEINSIGYKRYSFLKDILPSLLRRHKTRSNRNKLYQTWVETVEEAKDARDETTVSLLESKRKAEREKAENKLFARQNKQRSILGLKPLKRGENDDQFDAPDPLLDESAYILSDLVSLLRGDNRTLVLDDKPLALSTQELKQNALTR